MTDKYQGLDELPPGYYDVAEKSGNKVQRYWHTRRFKQIIESVDLSGKRVLDVGCGCGNFVAKIAEKTEFCVGIDAAVSQIEYAKIKFGSDKSSFLVSKAEQILYPDAHFDVVICSELIEHLEDYKTALKEMRRVLREGGCLILTTPNYKSFWPVLEWAWNKASKVDYYHQHVSKFNYELLKRELDELGFETTLTTFYIVAPFVSLVSVKIADLFLKLEQGLFKKKGMLLKSVSIKRGPVERSGLGSGPQRVAQK